MATLSGIGLIITVLVIMMFGATSKEREQARIENRILTYFAEQNESVTDENMKFIYKDDKLVYVFVEVPAGPTTRANNYEYHAFNGDGEWLDGYVSDNVYEAREKIEGRYWY